MSNYRDYIFTNNIELETEIDTEMDGYREIEGKPYITYSKYNLQGGAMDFTKTPNGGFLPIIVCNSSNTIQKRTYARGTLSIKNILNSRRISNPYIPK